MAVCIDENFWRRSLGKPDWCLRLGDDFKRLERLAQSVAVGQMELQRKPKAVR